MKILITGTSSGIGRELVKILVKDGHQVWGVARRGDLLESLKLEVGQAKFRYSVCDVANSDDVKNCALEMNKQNFIPDAVVLNSAVYFEDIKEEGIKIEELRKSVDINLVGNLFWLGRYLPVFLQRNEGKFIAVSSTSSFRPGIGDLGYSTTKAALAMLFRGLRLNYSNSDVEFITVHFGPIDTQMWRGKRTFLVPQARQAADFLSKIVLKSPRRVYYYPFFSTLLFRLTHFLPDSFFISLTKFLRK